MSDFTVINFQASIHGGRKLAYLRGKVFNVRLLLLKGSVRHEHREVRVFHTELLDLTVEELLDALPDVVGPGAQDVAAAHVVVLDHLRLGDDL